MNHRLLLRISIEHGYEYRGGEGAGQDRSTVLQLTPRPETLTALAGHRLVLRSRPDGVEVVAPVDANDLDRCFIALAPNLTLRFDLQGPAAELANYSDLSGLRALAAPCFTNGGSTKAQLTLSEGQQALARGALATVEISGLADGWLAAPPNFVVALAAREVRWIYYYVGEADENLAIIDRDPDRAKAPLTFAVEVADASGDRVAASLAERFPDRARMRLVSEQALLCRRQPRRYLALEGSRVITSELPNPGLDKQSTVDIDGQAHESLYHVVIT